MVAFLSSDRYLYITVTKLILQGYIAVAYNMLLYMLLGKW